MLFLFDLAFAVELVALACGIVLLIWSYRADKGGARGLGKVFGYIITIAAGFLLVCTFYHGVKHWKAGYGNFYKGGGAAVVIRK